jgi:hypothetical protein
MRVIAAVATLLLAASCALAGGGCGSTGLAGDQAVQFSIDRNFEFNSFQGQLFSYQRFMTDRRALRLAAGLSLGRDSIDSEAQHSDDVNDTELTRWNTDVTLKAQMVFYEGGGPLYFMWGCGPQVTYRNYHTENAADQYAGGDVSFILFSYEQNEFGLGLHGFAGVEWFINDTISLHAEYGASAMYIFSGTEEERLETDDPASYIRETVESRGPSFSSDGVRFGISGHF